VQRAPIHYLTRATDEGRVGGCIKHHILRIGRLVVGKMSAEVASKVLGGSSLLVLTRSER
jgi:hypothetical protein